MIIGVAGRIAAGKETLTQFLRDREFEYFETSKILSENLEKRGMELSRSNMQDLADKWRGEYGAGALMKMILKKMGIEKNYIIDSLRNSKEAEFLKQELGDNFVLIAVDAPREIRFKRIVERGKQSDMANWDDFLKVDERDNFDKDNPMGQQTGMLIEIADFVIMNDRDLDSAMEQVRDVWEQIKEKC